MVRLSWGLTHKTYSPFITLLVSCHLSYLQVSTSTNIIEIRFYQFSLLDSRIFVKWIPPRPSTILSLFIALSYFKVFHQQQRELFLFWRKYTSLFTPISAIVVPVVDLRWKKFPLSNITVLKLALLIRQFFFYYTTKRIHTTQTMHFTVSTTFLTIIWKLIQPYISLKTTY